MMKDKLKFILIDSPLLWILGVFVIFIIVAIAIGGK